MPFKFTSLKPEVRVYAFDPMGVSLHSQLRWRTLAKRWRWLGLVQLKFLVVEIRQEYRQ